MNKLYKIYFSDNDEAKRKVFIDVITATLKNITLYNAIGYWQGIKEKACIVEYIGILQDKGYIENVCKEIKRITTQEAILITVTEIESTLV